MAKPSAESLSIAAVSIPVRPNPPDDLTEYAQRIWRDVVNTKPPEWFESDSFPLLRNYCIAADEANRCHRKMIEITPLSEGYKEVHDLWAKSTKMIAELAVKMRLTQQSRYTPKAAATANKKVKGSSKPWED